MSKLRDGSAAGQDAVLEAIGLLGADLQRMDRRLSALDAMEERLGRIEQQLKDSLAPQEDLEPPGPASCAGRRLSTGSTLWSNVPDTPDDLSSAPCSPQNANTFAPREAWLEDELKVTRTSSQAILGSFGEMDADALEPLRQEASARREEEKCVIGPSSSVRVTWDLVGLCLICWDLVYIPVQLAFQIDYGPFTSTLFWLRLLFWTVDIPLSFFTGYYDQGQEELRKRKICVRYVTTWFLFDLLIVGVDWAVVVLTHSGSGIWGLSLARAGKTLRILRVLRSLRLLRLAKIRKLVALLQDQITSQYFHIIIYMAKLMLVVIVMNHLIACAFYALSDNIGDIFTKTWVADQWNSGASDVTTFYLYLTALHWSLTQFTPASMEVVARNAAERAFTVVVLVFALMVFSSFLSSITGAVTQLRQMRYGKEKSVSTLRRYLQKREISHSLSVRIIRYAEHQLRLQGDEIQEQDVRLLELLSEPMRQELVLENFSPMMTVHPFFRVFSATDRDAMRMLCNTGVKSYSLMEGDIAFSEGVEDDQMYFLLKDSKFTYDLQRRRSISKAPSLIIQRTECKDKKRGGRVLPEFWCCEGALWTHWVHLGTLRALNVANVLSVKAATLETVVSKYQLVFSGTMKYAQAWVERLNEEAASASEGGRPLSDLPAAFFDKQPETARLEDLVKECFVSETFRRRAQEIRTRSQIWDEHDDEDEHEDVQSVGGAPASMGSGGSGTTSL